MDSLSIVMKMSYMYYDASGDLSLFDSEWFEGMETIVNTFEEQKKSTGGPSCLLCRMF